jgi:hypothetical protein
MERIIEPPPWAFSISRAIDIALAGEAKENGLGYQYRHQDEPMWMLWSDSRPVDNWVKTAYVQVTVVRDDRAGVCPQVTATPGARMLNEEIRSALVMKVPSPSNRFALEETDDEEEFERKVAKLFEATWSEAQKLEPLDNSLFERVEISDTA